MIRKGFLWCRHVRDFVERGVGTRVGGWGGCSFSTCLKCSHSTIDHASLSRLEHQDGEERRGDGDERDTLSGVSSCMAHACLGGCVRRADA